MGLYHEEELMARKAELLEQAKKLKLDVTEKNTIAEIEAAISGANEPKKADSSTKSQETPKEESQEKADESPETPVAKAGKRSAKALREAEEQKAKEERKAKRAEEADEKKPSQPQNPTRTKLERKGKKFKKAAESIEKGKAYDIKEAARLAAATSPVSFDATVELHVRLGVDPKQADQNIRDTVVLPEGTGKEVKVAVFASPEDIKKAESAGADIAKDDAILAEIEKGQLDFDVLISTPQMMPKLGKYARILGPKGLMPNPKSGTVTTDVEKAVKDAKSGRIEYRVDSHGIVHLPVGKVSFGGDKIASNISAVFTSIKQNKPGSIKGVFVKSIHVTTSMGPSIKVDTAQL